ncbi:MAG: DUF418 domain-containing protein [Myxococcaceae bacterium]|nr:DUF418 domain-containing protein [Myxococcaceae bacterium]
MSSSLPAPSPPISEAQPVDGGERLALLDALRGFALCGVFISNVSSWFSGRNFLARDQMKALMANASLVDTVASNATMFLVFGKFITIFSFLFGLGFAVQLGRAEQRGASIVPLYSRRLGVLLLIGVSHLFLLWYGDVLSTYALLGFGLLLFRSRSDKALLIWAGVLVFIVSTAAMLCMRLPQLLGSAEATAKEAMERSTALRAQTLEAFSSGGYLEVVSANATYYLQDFIKMMPFVLPVILGRFLLGLVAGRRGLFHNAAQHLPLFRKVLLWGLVLGVLCNGVGLVMMQLVTRKVLNLESMPWLLPVMTPVRQLAELGTAAVYVAGFTLLFQRARWQRLLSVLAPVGRMALTHYLSQTVISLLLFYGLGLGLIGKAGPALCVALTLGIFSVQVVLSHLWLARFRFGPAEWAWRSLTYGKAQPMRRAPASAAVAATV